jgi:hypothetical protein
MAKTVMIVGAGASAEFGLPVGSSLQDKIHYEARLDNNRGNYRPYSHNQIYFDLLPEVVITNQYNINDLLRLRQKSAILSAGVQSANSIDNFLHGQKTDDEMVAIGKLAIATCILKAEAESSIGYKDGTSAFSGDRSNTQVRPDQSWLGALVKLLTAGQNFEAFCVSLSSIQFICFNYDRCIERYLHSVIPLLYPPKEFDEAELDASLEIIRPYGSLGMLSADTNKELPFGKFSDTKYVLQASGQIRTFTEGMDTDVRTRIGNAFSEASSVVFLVMAISQLMTAFFLTKAPLKFVRSLDRYWVCRKKGLSMLHRRLGQVV